MSFTFGRLPLSTAGSSGGAYTRHVRYETRALHITERSLGGHLAVFPLAH